MFWKHKWAFAHAGPCSPPWSRHGDCRSHREGQSHSRGGGHWHGGHFGVRRPLRYMARQLDLDEDQVAELAGILDDLKTQRAQARVDHRKAVSAFAEVFQQDDFDAEKVREATEARAASAAQVEQAVAKALEQTFALLDPEQRKRLAYLLRSEGITI